MFCKKKGDKSGRRAHHPMIHFSGSQYPIPVIDPTHAHVQFLMTLQGFSPLLLFCHQLRYRWPSYRGDLPQNFPPTARRSIVIMKFTKRSHSFEIIVNSSPHRISMPSNLRRCVLSQRELFSGSLAFRRTDGVSGSTPRGRTRLFQFHAWLGSGILPSPCMNLATCFG